LDIEELNEKETAIERFLKLLNKQVVPKEAGVRSFHEQTSSFSSGHVGRFQANSFKRRDKNRSSSGKRNIPSASSASALMGGVKQTNDLQCAFCDKKGHETSQCANIKDESCEDR